MSPGVPAFCARHAPTTGMSERELFHSRRKVLPTPPFQMESAERSRHARGDGKGKRNRGSADEGSQPDRRHGPGGDDGTGRDALDRRCADGHPVERAGERRVRVPQPAQHRADRRRRVGGRRQQFPLAESSGTGLCLDRRSVEPVPDQCDLVASGDALKTTQQARGERQRRDGDADRAERLHRPIDTGLSTSTSPAAPPRPRRTPAATRRRRGPEPSPARR